MGRAAAPRGHEGQRVHPHEERQYARQLGVVLFPSVIGEQVAGLGWPEAVEEVLGCRAVEAAGNLDGAWRDGVVGIRCGLRGGGEGPAFREGRHRRVLLVDHEPGKAAFDVVPHVHGQEGPAAAAAIPGIETVEVEMPQRGPDPLDAPRGRWVDVDRHDTGAMRCSASGDPPG